MGNLPAGFYLEKLPGAPAAEALIAALPWQQSAIKMFGRTLDVPRLTCWLGEGAYTYSGIRHEPAPMPAQIANLQREIEFIAGARFNSVLANYYRGGSDSVAEHADDEPELGRYPVIASVSLGASRTFTIRNRATRERTSIELSHGDLLVMSGRSQVDYLHGVPKTSKPVGPRANLTFRMVGTGACRNRHQYKIKA